MTMYIFKIVTLLGGLALFLFGMDIMGKALERAINDVLERLCRALCTVQGTV